jgi:hypothetical protein
MMNQHDGGSFNKGQDGVGGIQKPSGTDGVKMEEKYRLEIDRLLEMRPEMVDYQKEIERRLSHAGTFENRMAVLGIMMEDKLSQLQYHLSILAEKVNAWESMNTRG